MKYPLTGYHHITACAGGAQEDVNFFTQVVGLRMAKQTVLMDGSLPIYHLYFTDAAGTPGTVMTTFPMRRTRLVGRKGSGQFTAIAYSVPRGSLDFWREHFGSNNVRVIFRTAGADSPLEGEGLAGLREIWRRDEERSAIGFWCSASPWAPAC